MRRKLCETSSTFTSTSPNYTNFVEFHTRVKQKFKNFADNYDNNNYDVETAILECILDNLMCFADTS